MPFFGEEILEKAVTAILEGENILLCGDKATGKNVLAEKDLESWMRSIWQRMMRCPSFMQRLTTGG